MVRKTPRKEPCRIREIPFFQNYFVYLQVKDNARKQGTTYGHYMSDLLISYSKNHNYNIQPTVTTAKAYHEACTTIAHIEGISVSQVIEKIANEAIGQAYRTVEQPSHVADKTKPKTGLGSIFDLNRDAHKPVTAP